MRNNLGRDRPSRLGQTIDKAEQQGGMGPEAIDAQEIRRNNDAAAESDAAIRLYLPYERGAVVEVQVTHGA